MTTAKGSCCVHPPDEAAPHQGTRGHQRPNGSRLFQSCVTGDPVAMTNKSSGDFPAGISASAGLMDQVAWQVCEQSNWFGSMLILFPYFILVPKKRTAFF